MCNSQANQGQSLSTASSSIARHRLHERGVAGLPAYERMERTDVRSAVPYAPQGRDGEAAYLLDIMGRSFAQFPKNDPRNLAFDPDHVTICVRVSRQRTLSRITAPREWGAAAKTERMRLGVTPDLGAIAPSAPKQRRQVNAQIGEMQRRNAGVGGREAAVALR